MNEPRADEVIVQEVLQGNRNEFRTLVDRYHGLVYRVAYGMCGRVETAKDAVQEVFYRAFKRLDQFDAKQSFGAWVRRITVNYMLDQFKKKRIRTESMYNEEGEMIDAPDSTFDPRNELTESEREEVILNAVQQLPDKYRAILILRHFEDLSYEEIAQSLELPLGTVTTQLHRARNMLAERLNLLQGDYAFGE
ncbi:MAG: sigma-70 family RNA polymerase sigma factor [bacterium]|nr:sigma-70 family RNA polymerase sigma factor [bacterium]